ncbi:hypothetical protein C4A76_03640 [Brevibacillus laterosporus]|uniref:Uncharacterized protein n=1 Tax=Brevibacillus laterosporus TaxID=1465 RepID=A0A0F7EII7_BRELA|nr:hypothetical protein EX87_18050 [Brevibacillus laterosporus]PPA89379.1 hypothetical protein C4A76_03640 [Brevibacillus laterosporus]PPB10560.1 hypothetical protein C4A77_05140 [Brevibacillus laterosporus]
MCLFRLTKSIAENHLQIVLRTQTDVVGFMKQRTEKDGKTGLPMWETFFPPFLTYGRDLLVDSKLGNT